ncbi:DUF3868 domain-containing protein [uncultured Alistipes sp.]|jgi:Outer membrane protein and related peptidoglycan-associated (lipo)proteins|uniref:tetratricopeptide repeat protein n=1 Tax=uncultured Alistipes sp. TaxID=538949 RepID=UPI0025DA3427|nr:DUF3868 domain-containing protein [uncultured Alistipes sp.]
MKKTLYILIIALFCAGLMTTPAGAQTPKQGFRNLIYTGEIVPDGENVQINVTIDPTNLRLKSQEMIVFTPVLISVPDNEQHRFTPVVLSGAKRYKSVDREIRYGNMLFEAKPEVFRKHRNKKAEVIHLSYSLPFKEWMRGADLVMSAKHSGCVNCEPEIEQIPLTAIPIPEFRVTYIIPEAEVKSRSEKYTARLNYVVNKWDLLVNFKNNAQVLAEADQIIRSIVNNPDFKVTSCRVDGYASPEGRYQRNVLLAENRAQAFLNYLSQNYRWDLSIVSSEGHAEDWQGLRDEVEKMTWLKERDIVLDIIDHTPDADQRKKRLQTLAGGTVYRNLLNNVYPPLRRNEFQISYEIRPYSVEEAREVFKVNPNMLSLNEMFLVAQSYPAGSAEFKEVFDTTVRMFPESDIAKVNAGAMEIEQGIPSMASKRLQEVSSLPEAWNNLGVAYAHMGEYTKAAEYFTKAAQAGEINGQHNLDQIRMIAANTTEATE